MSLLDPVRALGAHALNRLPPETAHRAALRALAAGFGPRSAQPADPVLATAIAGMDLDHPVGLAAGFDKNAEASDALLAAGFSFVEVGAVTPRPQAGNPKPRLFRLRQDRAVINRMGFNNEGLEAVKARLEARRDRPGLVGVNLGANKDSQDRAADYALLLRALSGLAGFFTINISSPNTPGLRAMQTGQELERLLAGVDAARGVEPVFLKIAPDLQDSEIEPIVAQARKWALSGIIVSNTTLTRDPALRSAHADEAGGLSGAPLFERSTALLRQVRQAAGPDMTLIGVGGVSSAATAYAKIRAGANAVQLYTALIYEGPGLVRAIRDGLAQLVRADGFSSISDAVGADL